MSIYETRGVDLARSAHRDGKNRHVNFITAQDNSPYLPQLIAFKIKNRLIRQHNAQLRLIKEIIIKASLSGALSPKIATYLLKKTNLAGV